MRDHLSTVDPVITLTTLVVKAYVVTNVVPTTQLLDLIAQIHVALKTLGQLPSASRVPDKPTPAVPIRRSIHHDYLISLEDGQRFKALKRHLMGKYGMTPEEYRKKWGLPEDYPMVAPSYAAKRSELAKRSRLGTTRSKPATASKDKA